MSEAGMQVGWNAGGMEVEMEMGWEGKELTRRQGAPPYFFFFFYFFRHRVRPVQIMAAELTKPYPVQGAPP